MQRKHERVIQYLENYFIARFARLQQIVVVFTCQRKTYYIHMSYVFVCLSMKSPTSSSSSSLSARINKEKKRRCRPPLSVDEMAILAKETVVLPFLD